MNHYEVLRLPSPNALNSPRGANRPTDADIKQAYRLALLKHHPDKANASPGPKSNGNYSQNSTSHSKPSVDAIKEAYEVLVHPTSRTEYDRQLLLKPKSIFHQSNEAEEKNKHFRTGEEVVDLDDLQYNEEKGFWYRSCRCGETVSYVITEEMLEAEENKDLREIFVGCVGCSLWLRVAFGVNEELGDESG